MTAIYGLFDVATIHRSQHQYEELIYYDVLNISTSVELYACSSPGLPETVWLLEFLILAALENPTVQARRLDMNKLHQMLIRAMLKYNDFGQRAIPQPALPSTISRRQIGPSNGPYIYVEYSSSKQQVGVLPAFLAAIKAFKRVAVAENRAIIPPNVEFISDNNGPKVQIKVTVLPGKQLSWEIVAKITQHMLMAMDQKEFVELKATIYQSYQVRTILGTAELNLVENMETNGNGVD